MAERWRQVRKGPDRTKAFLRQNRGQFFTYRDIANETEQEETTVRGHCNDTRAFGVVSAESPPSHVEIPAFYSLTVDRKKQVAWFGPGEYPEFLKAARV